MGQCLPIGNAVDGIASPTNYDAQQGATIPPSSNCVVFVHTGNAGRKPNLLATLMTVMVPTAYGTPTHWCRLALQSLHVAQGGNDSNIG